MARPRRRVGNLPHEVTSFIGRRLELAELRSRLGAARLVTLVGPGGVGKTRLAVHAAGQVVAGFPDGAWLVELDEVADPSLVVNAVASALDLRDQGSAGIGAMLLGHLLDRELLLVLDNCEHLRQATAELAARILRDALGVRLLATSREPLSVEGEHLIPVPPLRVPEVHGAQPLGELAENEAIRLFVDRAVAASGGFVLTAGNHEAVADLCRRLDGLPLAIELAAVRTRMLSPEQILSRLNDRFSLLTGGASAALPRHQTLRTAIEWSHELLDPEERIVLRRLCVFAGSFTLEDVEAVCAVTPLAPSDGLDLLASLVDKSLVVKEDRGGLACYRLHETMREFALIKLREAGEEGVLEERLVDHFLIRALPPADEASDALGAWLEWVELEIDNLRTALRHAAARHDRRGARLTTVLAWYWIIRAGTEGCRWLDELLPSVAGELELQADTYFIRGFLAVLQADSKSARPALEHSARAARDSSSLRRLVQALAMSAIAADMDRDGATAERLAAEASQVAGQLQDAAATSSLLQARALHGFFLGDLETVMRSSREAVDVCRQAGDPYGLQWHLFNLGLAEVLSGARDRARPLLADSLRIARRLDDRVAQAYVFAAMGCCVAGDGEMTRASELLGAAESMLGRAGGELNATIAPLVALTTESAAARLGPERFATTLDHGRRLSPELAVALALGEPATISTPPRKGRDSPLARRELEVADLVAQGLTNRQIGARLFISERTVDTHVRSILNKLGYGSRAQIAGWAAREHHRER